MFTRIIPQQSVYGMTTDGEKDLRTDQWSARATDGQWAVRDSRDSCLGGSRNTHETRSKDDAVVEDRRAAFCARLKSARERKGVSLEEIAASTKISRSLLRGLEQNDLSRWPQGLYRRAYLRDYLRAIGLHEESTVAEFVRLFPGRDSTAPALPADGIGEGAAGLGALSMTLNEDRVQRMARVRKRITAAAVDLVAVLVVSGAAWWGLHADLPASVAIVALSYYSIGMAVFGHGLGSRLLEDRSWRRPKKPTPPAEPSLQDTLLERMREVRGFSGQPEPVMAGGILGMLIATIIRTLFLR